MIDESSASKNDHVTGEFTVSVDVATVVEEIKFAEYAVELVVVPTANLNDGAKSAVASEYTANESPSHITTEPVLLVKAARTGDVVETVKSSHNTYPSGDDVTAIESATISLKLVVPEAV